MQQGVMTRQPPEKVEFYRCLIAERDFVFMFCDTDWVENIL